MGQECMYCDSEKEAEDSGHSYPPYSYDDWICNDCWENCPKCGCSEWNHNKTNSTRKHNKKFCENCDFSYITAPATG